MSYIVRGIDSIDNISTLDNLSFNGSDATFNLTQNSVAFVPVSADALQIQIDGVIQSGNYTVSGSQVTFDFTPSGSSVCNGIRHFGVGLLTTVSDSSITTAKLGADSVNGSKIADNAIESEHLNNNIISGQTELATTPADTDELLLSDAGVLKRIDYSHLKDGAGIYTVVRSGSASSGDSYLEFSNSFNSTYQNYMVDIKNFKPSTDGADMEIKLGQSDGTYSSIFNYGAYMIIYNGNLHHYGGTNSSKFTPTWSRDNGAWHNVKLWVFNPMSTTYGKKCYSFLSETKRYDQEYGAVYGGGMCGIAAALPRFKITVNSGNITECDVTIYGITNSGTV